MHYVYIIKSGRFYKIGHTNNIPTRLRALRTGNPHGLRVLFFLKMKRRQALTVEKALHDQYKAKRKVGEWFTLSWLDVWRIRAEYSKYVQTPPDSALMERIKRLEFIIVALVTVLVLSVLSSFV